MAKKPQKQTLTFYNKYNRYQFVSSGWTTEKPSETVQGEAISMADMIRRYTRGEIPPLAMNAFHGHDVDMELHEGHTHTPDLSEVSALAELEAERQKQAAKQAEKTKEAKPTKEPASEAMKVTESESETKAPKEHEPA